MYEVSNEVMRAIRKEFVSELRNRYYNYNDNAINEILDEWCQQKGMLLNILSKHPNWNPERLMIHFDADYSRKLDINATRDFLWWLYDNYSPEDRSQWDIAYNFMTSFCQVETYLPEKVEDMDYYNCDTNKMEKKNYLAEINELIPELHARVGQKNTKIVGKICSHFGLDKIKIYGNKMNFLTGEIEENVLLDSYDKRFAVFCDALTPIKTTRHTCISVNPIDYLLMSNGNSWRSCHYIGDESGDAGCYSSGTISYMLDKNSIIFYTIDAAFDGNEIERELKIQRQVFGYNDFQLLQSRLYPQCNDCGATDTYTDIRNIMQKVFADCLDVPNRWIKKKVTNVVRGSYATCYADWSCQGSLCSTSILRGKENEVLEPIVLGAEPICINCGERHSYEDSIDHCNDNRYCCEECGCYIDEDYICWIGDYAYCEDCAAYCDCCGEYHLRDEVRWVESDSRYVCDDCIEEYYTYCDKCHEYVYNDNIMWIDELNMEICDCCLDEYYSRCDECGTWISNDVYDRNNGLCEDCAEAAKKEDEEESVNE